MQQAFSIRMRGRAVANGGLPLDEYTTDLWCALSTRPLLQSYTGNLIRVRRAVSPFDEQDIGQTDAGTASAALDVAALATFAGSDSVQLIKMYDQSGNARDTILSSFARAGLIVISGTLQTVNGHPAIYSGGIGSALTAPSAWTVFSCVETTDGRAVLLWKSVAAFAAAWNDASTAAISTGSGTVVARVDGVDKSADRTVLANAIKDGSPHVLSVSATSAAWGDITIYEFLNSDGVNDLDGKWADFVIYASASLADRAAIETALGA